MLKKMCPVCDLPLKPGNYCPVCRKVVRRPVTWEVDYYLNENHPQNEAVCGYHNPQMQADRYGDRGTTGKPTVPVRTVNNQVPSGHGAGNSSRASGQMTGNPSGTSGRGAGNPSGAPGRSAANPSGIPGRPAANSSRENKKPWNTFAGAGVAIVCVLLSAGINIAKEGFQGITSYYEDSRPVEIEEEYESFDEYGYNELEEADVIDAGKPCDGYFHFPGHSSSLIESMDVFLKGSDFGYTVSSEDLYTYNYETLDDSGKFSYFEKIYSFTLEDENTRGLDFSDEDYLYQYVDINYDTVTGQIHEYNSCFFNEEVSYLCLEEFLKQMEAEAGISQEDSSFEEAILQVRDDRAYIIEGIFQINIYRSEGQVEIYVTYNDPNAAANQET